MIVLITGGIKSGKSDYALQFAEELNKDTDHYFIATAYPGDEEMQDRIEKHQQSRSQIWQTIEETTDIEKVFNGIPEKSTVVLECLTLWLANYISSQDLENIDYLSIEERIKNIIKTVKEKELDVLFITNEVGLGIIPIDKISRVYQDCLGKINKFIAHQADEAYLMVCGLDRKIK
jgi:adenosylcobinamide kinase/adenosylcobinamide-phosphate guanylyltransferase